MADNRTGIALLEKDLARLPKTSRLSAAVDNVDRIIEQLAAAREQIASGSTPSLYHVVLWFFFANNRPVL